MRTGKSIGLNAKSAKARLASATVLAALLAAPPVGWTADAAAARAHASTYYDRAFVLAADARCRLFEAPVRAALTAAERQARGAALRAGASVQELADTAARAQARASTVACSDPALLQVRDRVAHAFAGWTRTPRMDFPGARSQWRVERLRRAQPSWTVRQESVTGASPVIFGQTPSGVAAVVSFVGRNRPYAARVVMRDPARSPRPWLAQDGGLPPRELTRAVWATGSRAADPALLSNGQRQGEAWSFPAELTAQIEALDPRESFVVEFVFRDDSVARSTFEVGDLAAARAFLALGPL